MADALALTSNSFSSTPRSTKEKLRVFVESGANAVERRRNVFAHVCPVRTTTGQFDFLGRRIQAVALPADSVHDTLGHATLQEFDQGVDCFCAIPTNGLPVRRLDGGDGDLDLVERRTGNHRNDLAHQSMVVAPDVEDDPAGLENARLWIRRLDCATGRVPRYRARLRIENVPLRFPYDQRDWQDSLRPSPCRTGAR
jgi:hypothetical protein